MPRTQERRSSTVYRAVARRLYHDAGTVEVDSNAKVNFVEDGAYVQAWVWVGDAAAEKEPTSSPESERG